MDMLANVIEGLGRVSENPSPEAVGRMMKLLRNVFFPNLYRETAPGPAERMVAAILEEQTGSRDAADAFVAELPAIRDLLYKDVAAVAHNDPAVTSIAEIVLSYPAITVMMHYRVAHALLEMGVDMLPRMITELAHSATGVDIHPAAKIGEYFAIDHGTGIVVGATSIIGNHVMLYQGVTLGAKNFSYDSDGRPIDKPRHPILEDNVTVYSNTSILGRVTVGHDTVVGGNVWLTHDVPPFSRILQTSAVTEPLFEHGAGI
ncbi:MAG: serine acetyltransferase [Bacteroidales bacterium]|nr:serine acetyltransferase [Candidatus Cryptobacteroides onthequi]